MLTNLLMVKIKSVVKSYWGELVYVFSNSYALVFSMVSSVVATAFIDPSDMGVIQTILLIQTYLQFLHLGVFNGLNRNLAYYKAKNENALVQDMVNTTYFVSFIVAFIGTIIALSVGLYFFIQNRPVVYIWSSVLLLVTLVFQPIVNAIDTTFRSGQEFKKLGVIKNIETTIHAVLSFLPILIGYIGKIIADSTRLFLGLFLRYPKMPYKRTGNGSKSSLILLFQTGFPILLTSYVWSAFMACDRTFIARYMSSYEMGLYSLSNYVIMAVMAVPQSVNALLYPKAAARYGATGDVHSLKLFWKKSLLIYSIMLVPLCVILYFLIPSFTVHFMPKYTGGIKAAQYSLLTCMTFVAQGPGVIFGTLRRNGAYLAVGVVSVVLFWGLAIYNKSFFNTIEEVALLRFALSVINMLFVLVLTYKYIK